VETQGMQISVVSGSVDNELPQCYDFAANILSWLDSDNDQLSRVCFCDETNFHISDRGNNANFFILGVSESA
jgi:hypothetical protein